jgi:hypothetical protein
VPCPETKELMVSWNHNEKLVMALITLVAASLAFNGIRKHHGHLNAVHLKDAEYLMDLSSYLLMLAATVIATWRKDAHARMWGIFMALAAVRFALQL